MLQGKRALVMGLANERSIAWGVTKALKQWGAEIALTYPNPAIEKRVRPLGDEVGAKFITKCDVTQDSEIVQLGKDLKNHWSQGFDIFIHSLAYAEKEDLENPFVTTSRKGFTTALDISAYSLVSLCHELAPMMSGREDASIITMTYYGSQKVMGNYNVMGVAKAALESSVRYLANNLGPQNIRVNAVSAGPIKTLAASGVKGLRDSLSKVEQLAPLRRNVSIDDVGATSAFLSSPMSRGITGQIIYVDSGLSILGAGNES